MQSATVRTSQGKFGQTVEIGRHRFAADEPVEAGGDDGGPAPHELLLAGLGACTSMTLKVYADRKQWPLESVEVKLDGEKTAAGYEIKRSIRMLGPLSDEQRAKLIEIAGKCPVHKTLTGEIAIATEETK